MGNGLGLIGYPLDHSASPSWFQDQFAKRGLTDFTYSLYPLHSLQEFPGLIQDHPELVGLNVTIPYKESIMPLLNTIDDEARAIGAVNTIVIRKSGHSRKLNGFNTDTEGFIRSADFSGHSSALVLGTGGSSKAVTYALRKLGINYTLVSRAGKSGQTIGYGDLDSGILSSHTLIINTSPLGMFPDTGTCPAIPYHLVTSRHFLYDLVYNPEETEFLKRGKAKGARVQSGLRMLHLQAEKALSLFLDA